MVVGEHERVRYTQVNVQVKDDGLGQCWLEAQVGVNSRQLLQLLAVPRGPFHHRRGDDFGPRSTVSCRVLPGSQDTSHRLRLGLCRASRRRGRPVCRACRLLPSALR